METITVYYTTPCGHGVITVKLEALLNSTMAWIRRFDNLVLKVADDRAGNTRYEHLVMTREYINEAIQKEKSKNKVDGKKIEKLRKRQDLIIKLIRTA